MLEVKLRLRVLLLGLPQFFGLAWRPRGELLLFAVV